MPRSPKPGPKQARIDVERVGGKNASLGEMISNLAGAGVSVPDGFATTADAYREFLKHEGLDDRINAALDALDIEDVEALAATGKQIREWVGQAPFPAKLEADIREAFQTLSAGHDVSVAVRSSATAEDLPDASFAGQQETFLNIRGIDAVLEAIKDVFASLFNDRAISYRVHHGFDHKLVALSAGIQRMVRSDIGASGVMFTMDTESGFRDVVFVTASWGLGEAVVQGAVNPDEFYAYKPNLKAGKPAIVRRGIGSKAIKMVYTQDKTVGKTTEFVDTSPEERSQFCLEAEDVEALARPANCSSCRRARKPCKAAAAPARWNASSWPARARCWPPGARLVLALARARSGYWTICRRCIGSSRVMSWSPT